MALKDFFLEQIDLLLLFMRNEPEQTVRCVRVDPEMKPLFMKVLAGLDKDENSPHLMLCSEVPFDNPRQFFEALLRELAEELARWEAPLKAAGFVFQPNTEELKGLPPDKRFVAYGAALADSLPDSFGSVVLILAPDRVADAAGYQRAVEFPAVNTPSPWMKFLVVDERQDPVLAKIDENNPNIWAQTFHIAPEEIESQAKADLARGTGLSPLEQRQYTGLLAGFAFARREYERALQLQQQWLDMLGPDSTPAEAANAHYNLGNTHLARKDHQAAEAAFGKALEIALENQLNALVPMALTNLGVTLYRLGRPQQALESFRIARDTCKAQGLRPTEAHVLDCLAKTYEADNKPDEAERCWRQALAVYDGMTSETYADARQGGRADILEKLDRLSKSRKQRKGA